MDSGKRLIQRLPESTNSWSCRWFYTIVWLCLVLISASLAAEGWVATFGLVFGALTFGVMLGMRELDG